MLPDSNRYKVCEPLADGVLVVQELHIQKWSAEPATSLEFEAYLAESHLASVV